MAIITAMTSVSKPAPALIVPVCIGGMVASPGDIVVGDEDGVRSTRSRA